MGPCVYPTSTSSPAAVETDVGQPSEHEQRLFLQGLPSQGSQSRLLHLAETRRQAEGWDSLMVGKGQARVCPMISEGCIFGFLPLVLHWKWEQKLEKLQVIHQVLTIWGQLLQGFSFGVLSGLLETGF